MCFETANEETAAGGVDGGDPNGDGGEADELKNLFVGKMMMMMMT